MRLGALLVLLAMTIAAGCEDGLEASNGEAEAGIPLEPNEIEDAGGAPPIAVGNGLDDTGEPFVRQSAEPDLAVWGTEFDVGEAILGQVVRSQEQVDDPIASSDAEAGTTSASDPATVRFSDDSADGLAADALGGASVEDEEDFSDEQDFEAVSSRETIESDAERLKSQQTERREFYPVPLPGRTGDSNVALFALQTKHDVGTKVYERLRLFVFEAGVRNRCAEYPDPEAAQQAFLDAGGPEDDELRIDPDGDGFVCGWSPEAYRSLLK